MKEITIKEFNEAYKLVETLDFTLAIEKLQTQSTGGWTKKRAIKAVNDYKKYLAITKVLDGYQLVPNGDIDEIWHYHIMDTRQYVKDCYEIFGGFLHHYPYFGMIDEENEKKWLETQEVSQNIWKNLFNEDLYYTEAQKCPQACPCQKDTDNKGIDYNYLKKFVA
ncbi:glycine-rich domain-containing protein [Malaciobacter marinus]|jgi:hypothetical protein|uniref:glycine-rich domain-containing protein n=1 Tax=Malaciobacter marinus TaxID=505249 RepID=UPI0009A6BCA5|nr:hypothetical protein [Malaciobacter marinus]SKB31050.1 hypothetical protein SAMN06295997_104142 [Malaciobacter marinus]